MTSPEAGAFAGVGVSTAGFIESAKAVAVSSGKQEDIAFTAEGVDRVIERLEEIVTMKLKKISRDQGNSVNVDEAIEGHQARMGVEDYVSHGFVNDVTSFNQKSDDFDKKMVKAIEAYIRDLKKVRAAYMDREDDIGQSFRQEMSV